MGRDTLRRKGVIGQRYPETQKRRRWQKVLRDEKRCHRQSKGAIGQRYSETRKGVIGQSKGVKPGRDTQRTAVNTEASETRERESHSDKSV